LSAIRGKFLSDRRFSFEQTKERLVKDIIADEKLVAKCGLYCGACRRYLKGKCPGCGGNDKASWCKVRSCNLEHGYTTCAECTLKPIDDCREYNNFIAKLFGVIFRSNRKACIERIRAVGPAAFAEEMTAIKAMSIGRPSGGSGTGA
jgi:hypothetical protein